MLDEFKNLFKDGLQYTHTAGMLQQLANLLNIVNPQYLNDENGKNQAIDLLCDILKSHKDVKIQKQPSQVVLEAATA